MFAVGDVVGSYTILAHLRSGGMADLFLARREGAAGFRRHVAIKVVHSRHSEDEGLVRMFLDEALLSARIDHPNVVHVEDLGELNDTYFLVMEYVHGCSLAQLMKVLGQNRRRLSPSVAVAIAARVAEGLHAAHETTDDDGKLVSLVHRDVSPQNILLSHKGHVKLIDFGVAKARLRSEETNVAMLKGKVRYMPPEQATTGLVDRRSDVYSLGIVLWEMLTMRRLFAGKSEFEVLLKVRDPEVEPPSKYVDDISPELDRVVLEALSKDPDLRPKDAKTFRRMLARVEPRSMGLDSAHLAELLVSVMGDQLVQRTQDLPQEVSRVLKAEQLRAAIAEAEKGELTGEIDTRDSAIDVLTLQSDIIVFEDEDVEPGPAPATRPGSPLAMARSGEMDAFGPPIAAEEPTLEDGDPTYVSDAPPEIQSMRARYIPHELDSEEVPTLPAAPRASADEPSHPPRLEGPVFIVPQGAPTAATPFAHAPITGATMRMQPNATQRWIALAAAAAISMVAGLVIALAWPFSQQEIKAVSTTPPPADAAPDAALPPIAAPADLEFDAGPPVVEAPARPPRRRTRRRRRRR